MKLQFWAVLFFVTFNLHRVVMWVACWTDFFQARCAFRSIGNFKFNNTRHNFARFETVGKVK